MNWTWKWKDFYNQWMNYYRWNPWSLVFCVGFQSTHWSPSSMIVVALESGVYVCKINDDCNVVEIQNNSDDPDNPFCHVLWNAAGSIIFSPTEKKIFFLIGIKFFPIQVTRSFVPNSTAKSRYVTWDIKSTLFRGSSMLNTHYDRLLSSRNTFSHGN